MQVTQAEFLISNTDPAKCPKPDKPEFAFIGRSNVGKSSLINMLVNRHGLAKTSGRPGKTQLINHFIIDKTWYLVDLPGYGYAKVPQSVRDTFGQLINEYLTTRPNLLCIVVLVDIRIDPQKIDVDFMTRLGEQGLPFVIAFTKAEKLKSGRRQMAIDACQQALTDAGWTEMPLYFITSATTKEGQQELLNFLEPLIQDFRVEGSKFGVPKTKKSNTLTSGGVSG